MLTTIYHYSFHRTVTNILLWPVIICLAGACHEEEGPATGTDKSNSSWELNTLIIGSWEEINAFGYNRDTDDVQVTFYINPFTDTTRIHSITIQSNNKEYAMVYHLDKSGRVVRNYLSNHPELYYQYQYSNEKVTKILLWKDKTDLPPLIVNQWEGDMPDNLPGSQNQGSLKHNLRQDSNNSPCYQGFDKFRAAMAEKLKYAFWIGLLVDGINNSPIGKAEKGVEFVIGLLIEAGYKEIAESLGNETGSNGDLVREAILTVEENLLLPEVNAICLPENLKVEKLAIGKDGRPSYYLLAIEQSEPPTDGGIQQDEQQNEEINIIEKIDLYITVLNNCINDEGTGSSWEFMVYTKNNEDVVGSLLIVDDQNNKSVFFHTREIKGRYADPRFCANFKEINYLFFTVYVNLRGEDGNEVFSARMPAFLIRPEGAARQSGNTQSDVYF